MQEPNGQTQINKQKRQHMQRCSDIYIYKSIILILSSPGLMPWGNMYIPSQCSCAHSLGLRITKDHEGSDASNSN